MGHNQTKDANGDRITIERVELLYQFLRGERVGSVQCAEMPHLSEDEAFSVIYFLQEEIEVLPDSVEQCQGCKCLLDADSEGYYREDVGHYCDSCGIAYDSEREEDSETAGNEGESSER